MTALDNIETALQTAVSEKNEIQINDLIIEKEEGLQALTRLQADALGAGSVADLKGFLEAYQELNKRVIGKCASYARQGDRVEVILQPRNPY